MSTLHFLYCYVMVVKKTWRENQRFKNERNNYIFTALKKLREEKFNSVPYTIAIFVNLNFGMFDFNKLAQSSIFNTYNHRFQLLFLNSFFSFEHFSKFLLPCVSKIVALIIVRANSAQVCKYWRLLFQQLPCFNVCYHQKHLK